MEALGALLIVLGIVLIITIATGTTGQVLETILE